MTSRWWKSLHINYTAERLLSYFIEKEPVYLEEYLEWMDEEGQFCKAKESTDLYSTVNNMCINYLTLIGFDT